MTIQTERLQKVIARSGITSRRKAEQLILDGRVKVNGEVVTTLGVKVSSKDIVIVDNVPIEQEKFGYYMLNKPRGYVTTVQDDRGRKTVIDIMEGIDKRLFPVGRLDYNTSGLLLLTNDGDFAYQLTHPKFELEKEYIAKIDGVASKEVLQKLRTGIRDGKDLLKVKSYRVKTVNKRKNFMIIHLTLHEGKNRHIRRMFEALGHKVQKLKREKYGQLTLETLQTGEFRPLTRKEVHDLKTLATKNVKY